MTESRRILVVVDAVCGERIDEALRAAVGLTLRGDRLVVAVLDRANDVLQAAPRPRATRALATLAQLGHEVRCPTAPSDAARAVREADAIEVWT